MDWLAPRDPLPGAELPAVPAGDRRRREIRPAMTSSAAPKKSPHDRALATLFPLFVVTEVVASQPWRIGPFQPGQFLAWANIAVLAAVIFTTRGMKRWPR